MSNHSHSKHCIQLLFGLLGTFVATADGLGATEQPAGGVKQQLLTPGDSLDVSANRFDKSPRAGLWAQTIVDEETRFGPVAGFSNPPVSAGYPDPENISAPVRNLYWQLLRRAPDSSSLAYYLDYLEAISATSRNLPYRILESARDADANAVDNKLAVMSYYWTQLDAGTPYGDIEAIRDILQTVTADPATVNSATLAINALFDDYDWNVLEEAHEIIDIGTVMTQPQLPVSTYKSADDPSITGDNEVPDDLWPDYEPPLPYVKNTTRNLQFNESDFIASPGEPTGVTSYVTTEDGYTWASMSQAINAMWPYKPSDYSGLAAVNTYYAGNLVITPEPGVVKATANYKAQYMKFWANQDGVAPGTPGAVPLDRYFVRDEWGNEYIMHASGQLDQDDVADAFAAAVLPPGWSKSIRQLSEDLILRPAEGADGSYHYLVWRDSADNTYHQMGWSPHGSLAAQIQGMPIWGGQGNDVLMGDAGGIWDDLIHGAGGDDLLLPGAGNDEIWGDEGIDTVVLPGARADYLPIDYSSDYNNLTLWNGINTVTLFQIEILQFDDGKKSVGAFIK